VWSAGPRRSSWVHTGPRDGTIYLACPGSFDQLMTSVSLHFRNVGIVVLINSNQKQLFNLSLDEDTPKPLSFLIEYTRQELVDEFNWEYTRLKNRKWTPFIGTVI